jgi:hypothetical protein
MSLIRVKDNPNLVRDGYSKAIINTDNKAYQDYVVNRERMKSQQDLVLNNAEQIQSLKKDVQEIKDILQQLAGRLKGKE